VKREDKKLLDTGFRNLNNLKVTVGSSTTGMTLRGRLSWKI